MSQNHGHIEWLDLPPMDYYRPICKAIYNMMKEQRSEDAKEFLVLVIAVTHELFSCMEISQWARGSIVLSTMNEAEKHLASKHIYAYLLQLFQDGSRHSIRATHM
ncbi:hypothetical protein T01_8035 [Trichinella spiralis]|uniref:Uncharacterized protein n=1 Tax=Trichinella spiralis TaxID=6334 RepID=A0A0V1BWS4_TRISP|nr:hypothetical protein T01_8035 [Trichinella spiralis]